MLDSATRKLKEAVLNPIASVLSDVNPNVITVTSLVPGLLCAWFAAQNLMGWALAMWIANRVLDGLDGTIARLSGTQTDFGGYLDILIDFLIYAIVPIGIVLGKQTTFNWITLVALLAVFYINSASWMYLSSILEKRGAGAKKTAELTTVTMPTGIIEGTETVIAYSLFLLFSNQIGILFLIFGSLVLLTIIQRLVWAKSALSL